MRYPPYRPCREASRGGGFALGRRHGTPGPGPRQRRRRLHDPGQHGRRRGRSPGKAPATRATSRQARTTNAVERLLEEFKRRIKTQTVLPSAETAAMLFWALLASGQINMRKVDGWQTLPEKILPQSIDLTA
jgi:hypothetical protein